MALRGKLILNVCSLFATQETEHQNQIEELRREIEERECHLKELDEEMGEMKSNVEQLQHELQAKGQEILSVRREANSQMRFE